MSGLIEVPQIAISMYLNVLSRPEISSFVSYKCILVVKTRWDTSLKKRQEHLNEMICKSLD